MKEVKKAKLSELIPDNKNFNKHTEYGMHLLEKSISELGIGRSILVDKKNRVIGGNGVVETVSSLGLDNCIIVPTDGKTLVVVQRTDIDLDSAKGRELALADNATSKANLKWDEAVLKEVTTAFEIDVQDWGLPEFGKEEEGEEEQMKVVSTRLIVECDDVTKLSELYEELQNRGYKCDLKE